MRAVISLGSNSTRMLAVRTGAGGALEHIEHRSAGTRLSEGLSATGPLAAAAKQRTLDAVAAFGARARELGAATACISTSVLRRATGTDDFVAEVERLAGAPLRILSGREEAEYSFAGATYADGGGSSRVAVIDVGGGSAECAVGRDGALEDAESVEIGAVRLSERHPALLGRSSPGEALAAEGEARADAAGAQAPFVRLGPVDQVRLVGGTATTLALIAAGTAGLAAVEGRVLGRAEIDGIVARLLALPLEDRLAVPGMVPQRADILPAGGIVISEALGWLDAATARVEVNDLLLGFLIRSAGR